MSEDIPNENIKVPKASKEPSAKTAVQKDVIANLERKNKAQELNKTSKKSSK